jgi:hypothetical protein
MRDLSSEPQANLLILADFNEAHLLAAQTRGARLAAQGSAATLLGLGRLTTRR